MRIEDLSIKGRAKEVSEMTPEELASEWKEIQIETHSRPHTHVPYPPRVVKQRELLLFLQVELSELEWAVRNRDESEEFHSDLYRAVKQLYIHMGRCCSVLGDS